MKLAEFAAIAENSSDQATALLNGQIHDSRFPAEGEGGVGIGTGDGEGVGTTGVGVGGTGEGEGVGTGHGHGQTQLHVSVSISSTSTVYVNDPSLLMANTKALMVFRLTPFVLRDEIGTLNLVYDGTAWMVTGRLAVLPSKTWKSSCVADDDLSQKPIDFNVEKSMGFQFLGT